MGGGEREREGGRRRGEGKEVHLWERCVSFRSIVARARREGGRRKEEIYWPDGNTSHCSFFFFLSSSRSFFSPSFLIATHHRYFVSSFFPRRQPRAEETRLGEKWRARESVLFVCRPRREVIVATFVITNHEFVLKI